MKKMTLATAALTAMIATSTTTSVFAAAGDSAYSTGEVSVVQNDEPTGPIDPDDPGTGMKGPLSIDVVPNYDFGEIKVGATTKNDDTLNQHLQTTDTRGTGAGWHVTVNYVDGAGTTGPNEGTPAPITADEAWQNEGGSIKGEGFIFSMSSFAPTTADNAAEGADYNNGDATKLTSTGIDINEVPTTIEAADIDGGMGTWLFGASAASTLTIPSTAKVADYTANLQWTILDAPSEA